MCKRSTAAAAVDHKLGFDTVFSMANIMYLLKESKVYKNGPTFGYLIFSFFPIVAAKEDIVVWLEKGKIKFRLFVAFWPVGHTISEEESQSALSVSQSSNSGPFAFFFPSWRSEEGERRPSSKRRTSCSEESPNHSISKRVLSEI